MASGEALKALQKDVSDKHHLNGGSAKAYRQRLRALHGDVPFNSDTVGAPPGRFGTDLRRDTQAHLHRHWVEPFRSR
jgi:hypothetical protein